MCRAHRPAFSNKTLEEAEGWARPIHPETPACQSPAPAARDSTWRGGRCQREKLRQPLIFLGLPVHFKLMILFYTFTKALGQRFDIFSSHWPRFIFLQKSCCPSKGVPQRFSYLLFLMCPCEYTVTHANVWAAYHIPQFNPYLSKSCLPLVS